jgi:hypothetical protein
VGRRWKFHPPAAFLGGGEACLFSFSGEIPAKGGSLRKTPKMGEKIRGELSDLWKVPPNPRKGQADHLRERKKNRKILLYGDFTQK